MRARLESRPKQQHLASVSTRICWTQETKADFDKLFKLYTAFFELHLVHAGIKGCLLSPFGGQECIESRGWPLGLRCHNRSPASSPITYNPTISFTISMGPRPQGSVQSDVLSPPRRFVYRPICGRVGRVSPDKR